MFTHLISRNLFTAPLFHACALYLICCSPVASLLHLPSAAKSSVAKLRTKMKEMKKIACDLFCCSQWDLKNRSPTFFGHSFIFVLNFAIWVFSTPGDVFAWTSNVQLISKVYTSRSTPAWVAPTPSTRKRMYARRITALLFVYLIWSYLMIYIRWDIKMQYHNSI